MSAQQSGNLTMTALLITFIVLKLTDTIDWSWWWVLAPLWGPLALWLAILAVGGLWIGLTSLGERFTR